jgi:3-oxoacyl-[acyl-carrier-protein] synthase-1
MLVLEEMEHAKQRGARIYAEIIGYGASSDGYDMVKPSGEGAVRCMRLALQGIDAPINYINAHGTGTPAGDTVELNAIKAVFLDRGLPIISSTKSLTGHALGAAGVHEAIYSLIMLEHDFICASANITHLDERTKGMPIALERVDHARLTTVMSNSFGFGGTNATLVFQRYS